MNNELVDRPGNHKFYFGGDGKQPDHLQSRSPAL